MIFKKSFSYLAIAFLLAAIATPQFSARASNRPTTGEPENPIQALLWAAPDGFEIILSEPAVTLYRKNYPNGTPDFVQVVQLGQGAVVQLLHGDIAQQRPEKGAYGGDDARFHYESMKGFWAKAIAIDDGAFCVVNGSFFYMPETPTTRLPFSLKVDGAVLTDGFGVDHYPEQKLMLELWADHADIRPLNGTDLYNSTAPNIIAGLTAEANKRAEICRWTNFHRFARSGCGRADGDFVHSQYSNAHPKRGSASFTRFGADKVMMLDGGGSTQLSCLGKEYIATDRLIPQAVAVFAADPGGLAARLIVAPDNVTGTPGEPVVQEWVLENTGELAWLPDEHRLVLEAGPYWTEQHFSAQQAVLPGSQLQFSWELPAFSEAGVYPLSLRWFVAGTGRRSDIQQFEQELVIVDQSQPVQSARSLPTAQLGWQQSMQSQPAVEIGSG